MKRQPIKEVSTQPRCTDPEPIRPHRLGDEPGSCHTCAMQYDSNFNLIESKPTLGDHSSATEKENCTREHPARHHRA